jgi:hypothetical protein
VIRLSPILDTGRVKIGNQDPEAYRQRLEATLRPERIRATLGFAGLYQMIHELIKTAVLDEVREFYWRGIEDGVVVDDEHAYAEDVLARASKNKFRASLLCLVEGDAITLGPGRPAGRHLHPPPRCQPRTHQVRSGSGL